MYKNLNDNVPTWAIDELRNLKASIRLQEAFQWGGLVFSLMVLFVAPAVHQQVWDYALFMVPLNYFAVARSDYLIHRNGAKARAFENYFGYAGNENLQKSGKSYIAIFDIPAFIFIAVLGKLVSPYPLNDFTSISIAYWVLCAAAALFGWLAAHFGSKHFLYYKNALEQYRA